MLSQSEVRAVLHTTPFEPFRIEVSDGTTYDIRHPDQVLTTATSLHIGIPMAKDEDGHERSVIVALVHVVKIAGIPAAKAKKG